MPKDDYFVIAYRLLKYLYDCLKKSKQPNPEVLDADFFTIDSFYWEYIIKNLYLDEYITGVILVPILGKHTVCVKITVDVQITPKGIQYLNENSMFQTIRGVVKDVAEIIPI